MTYRIKNPHEFGRLVGFCEQGLCRLAVWAATQASDNLCASSDAKDILTAFLSGKYEITGEPMPADGPHKVQVSKLAQVIKAGETFRQAGVDMLEDVADLYKSEFQKKKYEDQIRYVGEYNLLIDVARAANARGKILSRSEIIKLATK